MQDTPSALESNKAVPDITLPMLDEILTIAPGLEANWAAERASLPPGTLVNDGGDAGEGEGEADGDAAGGGDGEESFIDSFDLDSVDPAARPAVEALQKEWQGNYTKRRQADREEISGVRREAEQQAALIDGLRDPSTMPHYLRLMGIDLTDASTLEALGISGGGRGSGEIDDELQKLLDDGDEDELETRLANLEGERATEKQEREAGEVEQALDDLADQELEKIEGSWGRELDDDEDAFIRHRAEATPGPDGLPDYESAAATLKGWLTRREQQWAKERSKPGRGAPGGKPGGKALDPTKEEDRLALAAAAAEKAMASQQ